MPTATAFKPLLAAHLFNNAALANIGDASGLQPSGAAGNYYISLHTGNPIAGNQATNEATAAGYARVAIPRNSGGLTIVGGVITNTADIVFPALTGGAETATYIGVGASATGAGTLCFSDVASPNIPLQNGIQPKIAAGQLIITIS